MSLTNEDREARVEEFRAAPPFRWDALVATCEPSVELNMVSLDLSCEAIGATRRAAYVNARSIGKDHATGVFEANACVRVLAKALGFMYPKSHDLNF